MPLDSIALSKIVPLREAADFLESLLRPATPDSYLEIRPMQGGDVIGRAWHRVGDLRSNGFETALPLHLDGKASVYYGVCPRVRRGGTGEDVSQAVAVWFDEITRPAPDLPPFSWMLETSPGKVQGGYFLKDASRNLDRVERLAQRLGTCVGGDRVWNRDRILRLPGFINAKYPDGPRSYLLEFHPDRRYTLEELERLIPVAEGEEGQDRSGTEVPSRPRTGQYDPHRGAQLADADQAALAKFLLGKGLKLGRDGRFNGSCIFHGCECPGALYVSMKTGSHHCFCNSHPGNNYGDVGDLAELGFSPKEPRLLDSTLSWQEVEDAVGQEPQSFYPPEDEDVRKKDKEKSSNPFSGHAFTPRKKRNVKPSALWDWCEEQFPLPTHRRRPSVDGAAWVNPETGEGVFGDIFSHSWFNPINAAHKRQTLLKHIITTFSKHDTHCCTVASDDWDEDKHEALRKAIMRRDGEYYAVDNRLSRGYWVYFSTVPAPGFEPVDDLVKQALSAIKGISVPTEKPGEHGNFKFRPTRASQTFKVLIDDRPADDDKGKLEMVARRKDGTDFALLEANLREAGRAYQYCDPIYRGMPYQCLKVGVDLHDPFGDVLDLAVAAGFEPLRKHRQAAGVAS